LIAGRFYVKEGVSMEGMRSEYFEAIPAICRCFGLHGSPAVLTSGLDGEHMEKSLHYDGLAGDWRIWHVTKERREELAALLRFMLGPSWDVVLEETHIHIERQLRIR